VGRYIFTAHAEERLIDEDITQQEAIAAIERPRRKLKGKKPGRYEVKAKPHDKMIIVVYEKHNDDILVITAFGEKGRKRR